MTLTGEILDSSGYISGGKANDEETSVLGRRREIINLDETLSMLRHSLIKVENRKKSQIIRLEIVGKTLEKIDTNLQKYHVDSRSASDISVSETIDKETQCNTEST